MKRLPIAVVVIALTIGLGGNIVSADPTLPLPRLPIGGDQDGSETPFVLHAPGFDLLTDVQTFPVPGTGSVDLTFDFVFREAIYNNEFGFFRVDNAVGQINGLNPGDSGYLTAALDRAVVVFPSGSTAYTPDVTQSLNGGDVLAFFIVQDSTLASLRANNPTNGLNGSPLAFFSIDVLNPDSFDHFVGFRNLTDNITQFGFEDMTSGGDKDYDDIVYNIKSALPPSPPFESRDIVFVRGIDSVGDCDRDRANEWVKGYMESEGKKYFGNIQVGKYLHFNYAGGGSYTCPRPTPEPTPTPEPGPTPVPVPTPQPTPTPAYAYTEIDTCDGVTTAAEELKALIEAEATAKVTIVGHSMGGIVAAYLVASNPEWAKSHVASVVTFDSPLKGLKDFEIAALEIKSPCSFDDGPPSSLGEMLNNGLVISIAADAARIVPFYPLDATQFPDFIPRERATLDSARPFHLINWCDFAPGPDCEPPRSVDDDHSSIWDRRFDEHSQNDKAFLVGCAAIAASDCAFFSVPVAQGRTTQTQAMVGLGTERVRFASNFGSTVQMTLISSDGAVYGPDGAGAVAGYAVDAESEVYEIVDPTSGTWTIELFGVDVPPAGEEVELAVLVLERSGPAFYTVNLPIVMYDYTPGTEPANRPPNTPSNPWPYDGATSQSVNVNPSWTGGDPDGDSVTYDVYLGVDDSTPDALVCYDITGISCDPGTLSYETHYYWQVVARDELGATTTGPVWDFTTSGKLPNAPSSPSPADGAANQSLDVDLSWIGGDPDGDSVMYDVYFEAGDSTPDVLICNDAADTFCDPGTLNYETHYYWRVVARDEHGLTRAGPVWDFTTVSNSLPNIPSDPSPADGATNQSLDVDLSWTGGDPDGDSVTYDIYFEASDDTPDVLTCDDVTSSSCDPGTLGSGTHYYWRVVARDEHGLITTGPVWEFTTLPIVQTLNFKVSFQARDNADDKPQNVPIQVKIKNLSDDQPLFETGWVSVTPAGSSDNWGTTSVDVSSATLTSGQSYRIFVTGAMHLTKQVTIPLTDGLTIDYTDPALNPDGVLWACDANQDNQVNNADMDIVGSHFGATVPTDPDPSSEVYCSDQDGDRAVNVLDLVICGQNDGRVGD